MKAIALISEQSLRVVAGALLVLWAAVITIAYVVRNKSTR